MNKKFLTKISAVISACIILAPLADVEHKAEAFTNQVVQQGAVGDDVIELQARLQYIGFYNGKIDGVFGWKTYWALRNFQYEFGLPIDGMASWQTKLKLAKASKYNEQFVKEQINSGKKFSHYGGVDLNKQKTPSANKSTNNKAAGNANKGNAAPSKNSNANANKAPSSSNQKSANQPKTNNAGANKANTNNNTTTKKTTNNNAQSTPTKSAQNNGGEVVKKQTPTAANVPNGFSQNDIQLMANAVYGESRGEPYIGQVAVASVILNRVSSASFPNTVSGVIFEPRAFTAVADGQIWLTPNETAKKAVLDAINGWDPTGNAIYYFNPDTATSGWIWSRPQIKQIGKHIFCK